MVVDSGNLLVFSVIRQSADHKLASIGIPVSYGTHPRLSKVIVKFTRYTFTHKV